MGRFDGKAAVVTGGGTGIGRAIAEGLAREGARVIVTGRREGPLQALAASHPGRVLGVAADVTSAADRKRLLAAVERDLGRLDVLVNNAGTYAYGPVAELTDEDADRVLRLNVLAVASLTRDAIPLLTRARGNLVNVSSIVATGAPALMAIYTASKAAVDALTRVLAVELGPAGVRVNAVAPGLTVTDMAAEVLKNQAAVAGMVAATPLGRVGQPAEVAEAALFLASDQAGWITGQVLDASGGARM